MHRLVRFFAVSALLVITPLHASAQDDTCLHRTLPLGIDVPSGLGSTQIPISGFQAKVHGKTVKILSVVPDYRPHRIVIMLDASGSMEMSWPRALSLGLALANSALPNTQLALVIFAEGTKERIDFTQGQEAVRERLRQLSLNQKDRKKMVYGRTSILDALLEGMRLLEPSNSADCLYLISDGGEISSRVRLPEVAQRLTSSGVRLFFALMERSEVGGRGIVEEVGGPPEISELARKTGGEIRLPLDFKSLRDAKEAARYSEMLNSFHYSMIHSYRLEVELPERLRKAQSWELRLAGENKQSWKDVRLNYPTELAACGP